MGIERILDFFNRITGKSENRKLIKRDHYDINKKIIIQEEEGTFDRRGILIEGTVIINDMFGNKIQTQKGKFGKGGLTGERGEINIFRNETLESILKGTFKNGRLNGEGEIIDLYENGNPKQTQEGNFMDGRLNGKGKIELCNEDGILERILDGIFEDGELKRGKITDLYNNGNPQQTQKGNFKDGRLTGEDGEENFYDENGILVQTRNGNYKNGRLDGEGEIINLYENGIEKQRQKGIFRNGILIEGEIINKYRNGKLEHTLRKNFKNGELTGKNGKVTLYDEDGILVQTRNGNYKNGRLDGEGEIINLYENGIEKQRQKGIFRNGILIEGEIINKYRNGKLEQRQVGTFEKGELTGKNGKVTLYDEDGILVQKQIGNYKNGKLTGDGGEVNFYDGDENHPIFTLTGIFEDGKHRKGKKIKRGNGKIVAEVEGTFKGKIGWGYNPNARR